MDSVSKTNLKECGTDRTINTTRTELKAVPQKIHHKLEEHVFQEPEQQSFKIAEANLLKQAQPYPSTNLTSIIEEGLANNYQSESSYTTPIEPDFSPTKVKLLMIDRSETTLKRKNRVAQRDQ